ncbi:MAG: hypothetical protein Q9194_003636 [Teloschistes cf. exilis]
MSSREPSEVTRVESPDPSSHATNIYDAENGQDEWLDEEDDDDMDFEPATDDSEAMEFFDPAEANESDFYVADVDDGLSGVEIGLSANDDDHVEEDENESQTEATGTERPLINSVPVGRIHGAFTTSGNPPDDDDDPDNGYGSRRRRRGKASKERYPTVPSEEGGRLMATGTFGESEHYEDRLRNRKGRLTTRLMYRELGISSHAPNRANKLVAQSLIPSSNADTIIHYNDRCYSGQFSDDGNFFFSCGKDFKVRMYDTSNPYKWKYYKTAIYPYGQWTITDASLSPDNRFLAYSSIRSVIWSIRFSGDGREVVAGTSNQSVYVYDIEAKRSILQIRGHNDDVNAVCFGDKSSPHILYSGSDDTLIKVWDRRSMGDSREAGVFMGHTEGLTYVDSKGDGRYVLSNGKDQTMKLWDLRKMMSTEKASKLDPGSYSTGFDYRFMAYTEAEYQPHPYDCSLVTFRGHRVLKTLIRCHFSPPASTDSRYVYSGSEDGSVYIYNMDATLAGRIDVNKATHHSRPKNPDFYPHQYEIRTSRNPDAWKTCVRDASWHPDAPVIAATSWNGWGMSTGTCTTHSWNDGAEDDESEPKMGMRVNQRLEDDEDLYDRPQRNDRLSRIRSRLRSQVVRAADDDDDVVW